MIFTANGRKPYVEILKMLLIYFHWIADLEKQRNNRDYEYVVLNFFSGFKLLNINGRKTDYLSNQLLFIKYPHGKCLMLHHWVNLCECKYEF